MKISDTRSPVKTFSVSSILTNISMVLCMETNDYFQSFGTTKTRIISRIFIYINHRRSSCRRGFKGAAALPDKEGNQKVMNEELLQFIQLMMPEGHLILFLCKLEL